MLPQLEHSLRRMYATVNEMPERVQTAESAEFYTTFNEVSSAATNHAYYAFTPSTKVTISICGQCR